MVLKKKASHAPESCCFDIFDPRDGHIMRLSIFPLRRVDNKLLINHGNMMDFIY